MEFRYLAPRRAWRRWRNPSPLALQSATLPAALPDLVDGFWNCTPTVTPLCRILSVVDPAVPENLTVVGHRDMDKAHAMVD